MHPEPIVSWASAILVSAEELDDVVVPLIGSSHVSENNGVQVDLVSQLLVVLFNGRILVDLPLSRSLDTLAVALRSYSQVQYRNSLDVVLLDNQIGSQLLCVDARW